MFFDIMDKIPNENNATSSKRVSLFRLQNIADLSPLLPIRYTRSTQNGI
jgi:hypothetical protein